MRLSILAAVSSCLFVIVGTTLPAAAQSAATHTLITEKIDEAKLVTLEGNTRPEATAENDAGALADDYALDHLKLQLKRPADREVAFDHLIEAQSDINSDEYHHWLSAEEVGQRYGVATEDLDTITKWLTDHGFKVNRIYSNHMLIDFSGTAGQIRATFSTEMHALSVGEKRHIANMSDPKIPAALAPAIEGIMSLNNFFPRATMLPRADYTYTADKSTYHAIVPGDLAAIYDLNPLFKAGITGKGQTIAVFEDTNVFTTADWTNFRKAFGLSTYTSASFKQVHPGTNCSNPGVNGDDGEAILDAEWASAAAPNAAIVLASCADTDTDFGALTAFQNIIAEKTPPKIASFSYGACESEDGAAFNNSVKKAFQQAASEGISVFVSTGDSAADVCDRDVTQVAESGISVNGLASTVYNVAVGGTDFEDSYLKKTSTYWNSKNTATFESARSYIPEIPWNDSCASSLLAKFITKSNTTVTYGETGFCNSKTSVEDGLVNFAGGSGGPSKCATGAADKSDTAVVSGTCKGTPKPSWQSVFGNPKDSVRDLPDVSLFAANGVWGHYYVFCYTDASGGGAPCKGAPSTWSGAGGTSFSTPIMAGIQSLVNEKTKSAQGNPAPTYYKLATKEFGTAGSAACDSSGTTPSAASCIFHDVTAGDMDIPCQSDVNCFWPSGVYGVLSTSNTVYKPAYASTKGWDFATGIGTIDAAKLVNGWPTKAATAADAITALSD